MASAYEFIKDMNTHKVTEERERGGEPGPLNPSVYREIQKLEERKMKVKPAITLEVKGDSSCFHLEEPAVADFSLFRIPISPSRTRCSALRIWCNTTRFDFWPPSDFSLALQIAHVTCQWLR